MSEIDWDDPDFCTKYKYRNGDKILAVHTFPCIFHALTDYRHATIGGGKIYRHLDNGRICNSYSKNGFDIVPVPRELRTIEGWMLPYVFDGTDLKSFGVLTYQPQFHRDWVKIKLTEVIE